MVLLAAAAGCGREQPGDIDATGNGAGETGAPYVAAPAVETELNYVLVKTLAGGLTELRGIAIDTQDRVYLAGAEGVRVLAPEGNALKEWRTSGPARCVAVDADGNAYVGLRAKVEKYDGDGKLVASWGEEGKGRGEFGVITGISISGVNVFVADAGNRCVHRFDLTGDFIDEIGKRDPESGVPGLVCPSPYLDCTTTPDGFIYIANPGRQRVEKYQADGELVSHFGLPGTQPERFSGCCNPSNLALTPDGGIVTAEKVMPRVKVYDANGKMLAFIGSEFFSPKAAGLDLAVDSAGRLYVVDPLDGKVRVFERKE